MYLWIFLFFCFVFFGAWGFFLFFEQKIQRLEQRIISYFQKRNDIIPSLYEVHKIHSDKYREIFQEILEYRKQEFHLGEITKNLEAYIDLEKKIHHELNFIFQISQKNPKLIKDKKFLYLQDIILEISRDLGKIFSFYKKNLGFFNTCISWKNRTLIGYLIPVSKKTLS